MAWVLPFIFVCGILNWLFSEQIEKEFKFFPRLHRIFAARPNVTPIVITTGVGPQGMKKVWYRPPEEGNSLNGTEPLTPPTLHTPSRTFGADITTNVTPVTISTPAATCPAIKKENLGNVTRQHAPKASVISHGALEKAHLNIQKVPQKRSLIDTMLEMQEYVWFSITSHLLTNLSNRKRDAKWDAEAREKLFSQKRGFLIEELKLGVWTHDQYISKLEQLEAEITTGSSAPPTKRQCVNSAASSPNSRTPTSTPACADSPDWDLSNFYKWLINWNYRFNTLNALVYFLF